MSDAVYITKDRLLEMEAELHNLKVNTRKEIAQKIADARSHGDLSENADYDAAKHEQELLEMRISKLQTALSKAQVIEASDFPDDKIYILSKVTLLNLKNSQEFNYTLVSPEEADFDQNKISVSSPLGKALLGKVLDEVVSVKVPAGMMEYKILKISK
jgi:transcription elongation factor GreA